MFRKKKGPGSGDGFNRISRLIEDRQRELADGGTGDELDGDTIVMRSGSVTAVPAPAGDEDTVSLLDVRGHGSEPDAERGHVPDRVSIEDSVNADPAAEARPQSFSGAFYDTPGQSHGDDYSARREGTAGLQTLSMRVPDIATVGGSSLVASDATWEGKLRSQGDIRVEGTLRGEIETEATLIVAPHARIHGTVRARNIMLGGDVEGDIACDERLEILPGGSARGQINSGTLVVHEGAYIDSRFQMRRDAAVSEA